MLFTRDDTYAAFMLDHAAGTLPESLALAGDLHMMMHAPAAKAAYAWSIIGGALLESESGETLASRSEPERRFHKRQRPAGGARSILEAASGEIAWKRGLFGAAYFPLGVPGGKLMKLEAGQGVPKHGHSAIEATVVIQGRLRDGFGEYGVGELMLGEPGMHHKPVAAGSETCICYVAEPPRFAWRLQ